MGRYTNAERERRKKLELNQNKTESDIGFLEIDPVNSELKENNPDDIDLEKEQALNDLMDEYEMDQNTDKKKNDPSDEIAKESFAQVTTLAAHVGLNILIARMPKNIPLTDEESKSFDEAFTNLAKKYYFNVGKYSEEINFGIVLTFLLIPRIEFNKNKKDESFKPDNNKPMQ